MPDEAAAQEGWQLGRRVTTFEGFDLFEPPDYLTEVTMESDEVTSVCPVTGQPDQYIVTVHYVPCKHCIESKSLKLYLQQFRNEGQFCEKFAARIAEDIMREVAPHKVSVTIEQKPRGGVMISATAEAPQEKRDAEDRNHLFRRHGQHDAALSFREGLHNSQ